MRIKLLRDKITVSVVVFILTISLIQGTTTMFREEWPRGGWSSGPTTWMYSQVFENSSSDKKIVLRERSPLSGTLSIRYVKFDDTSSYPQYDFDENLQVTVEVDTTKSSQNVDLFVILYDPDGNDWDWDHLEYTTYGSSNDPKTFYLSTSGDLDQWLDYVGKRWHVTVLACDADTHAVEDEENKYFWAGPRIIRHFTCKDYNDPDGTRTSIFYDNDYMACEYTEWDTHGLYIWYTINFKFYDPYGNEYFSTDVDIAPDYWSYWAAGYIYIKDHYPAQNPGSWHVNVYIETRYRFRDDFTIESTTKPLDVTLISPADGSVIETAPIELKARVTSEGMAVQDALVEFYIDGSKVGSDYSDSSGYASIYYTPPVGEHTWYVIASKIGYDQGESQHWRFTYNPPQPDFGISASPDTLSIAQGDQDNTTVFVTSINNFDNDVTLSMSDLPTGVSYSFSKNPVHPPPNGQDSTTLTLFVDSNTPLGTYQPKIIGSSGSITHQYPIELTITAPEQLVVNIEHDKLYGNTYFYKEKATFTVTIKDTKGNLVDPDNYTAKFDGRTVSLTRKGVGTYEYTTDKLIKTINSDYTVPGIYQFEVTAYKSGYLPGSDTETIQCIYNINLMFSVYEQYFPVDGLDFDGDGDITNNYDNYVADPESYVPSDKDGDLSPDVGAYVYVTESDGGQYIVMEYWIYYAVDHKEWPLPSHEHDFESIYLWIEPDTYEIKRVSLNQHFWANSYEFAKTPWPIIIGVENGGHGMILLNFTAGAVPDYYVVKPHNTMVNPGYPSIFYDPQKVDEEYNQNSWSFGLYPWKQYKGTSLDDGFGDPAILLEGSLSVDNARANYAMIEPYALLGAPVSWVLGDAVPSEKILLKSGHPYKLIGLLPLLLQAPWTRDYFIDPSIQWKKLGYSRAVTKIAFNLLMDALSSKLTTVFKPLIFGLKMTLGYFFDPINGTIIDSQGRTLGYKNGTLVNEIPSGFIFWESPTFDVYFVINGTEDCDAFVQAYMQDQYNMTIVASYVDNVTVSFDATNIPVQESSVHKYTADWDLIRNGENGMTIQIDQDGDGNFEKTIQTCSSFAPPSLTLFDPEIDGLTVTINGVTLPGTEGEFITRIHWDWGDGCEEDHWFPATHTYDSYGNYTIIVTSYQSDGFLSTTAQVNISLIATDIAIVEIRFSTYSPIVNQTVIIMIYIKNNGNTTETFSVSVNYTRLLDPLIGTQTVILAPGESIVMNFTWVPSMSGRYEIIAYTSEIPNEIDAANNTKKVFLYVWPQGLLSSGGGGSIRKCLLR